MDRLSQMNSGMIRSLGRFLADDGGATAIEYGLIVALISVTIMGTLFAMGSNIKTVLYQQIVTALQGGG